MLKFQSVIFVSNGKFEETEEVAKAAKNLRTAISNVFMFAATDNVDVDVDSYEKITVPDGEKNIYLATSFNSVDQYTNKIAVELCKRGNENFRVSIHVHII